VGNRLQALRCKAFKITVIFSPMHYNEGMRPFCRSGVSREARTSSGGAVSRDCTNASFAADAALTSSQPACGVLHKRCAQWLEKAVDNRLQALRCKAFKIVAKYSPPYKPQI